MADVAKISSGDIEVTAVSAADVAGAAVQSLQSPSGSFRSFLNSRRAGSKTALANIKPSATISYAINILSEDYGYRKGSDAAIFISGNISASIADGQFLDSLRLSGNQILSTISETSVLSITSTVTYIHSASPTARPAASPEEFFVDFPLYGKILFIAGGVIVLTLITLVTYYCCGRKHQEYERHETRDMAVWDRYDGRQADAATSSPGHVVVEMNP